MRFQALVLIALNALVLAACAPTPGVTGARPTATIPLILYQTAVSTATVLSEGSLAQPSATPFIYVVIPNDTLIGIATRFKISLQALEAANPNVDARFLIPGTQLLIPVEGQSLADVVPTLTPVPAVVSSPQCYSSAAGELWCFILVSNESDQTMENLSGLIQLVSAYGDILANVEAVAPLDILPAGSRMPLVAYLSDPPGDWVEVQGQILTSFWLPVGDANYLEAHAVDFNWSADGDSLAARVQGRVALNGDRKAGSVWVLAVAYDAVGRVTGVRRWESAGDLVFDFWVYSLGPKINDVQVLVEARP